MYIPGYSVQCTLSTLMFPDFTNRFDNHLFNRDSENNLNIDKQILF